MHVFIAGANGQIGQHLLQEMADSDHEARALVRHQDQGPELQQLGATETVLGDLEQDCSEAMRGCDAVIFTAGSGPHTGPDKTVDVDQNGAIRLVDTAKAMGIKRFIMVSSMRAEEAEKGPEKLRHYLWAKHNADEHLKNSGLDYTIVRPGQLTNDEGTGKVTMSARLEQFGKIPRQDVARVLLAALESEAASNRVFDVVSGDTPISEAISSG
ncbi:SDR family oxidoreductase [Marinobacter orientalis]|uniref:SDR family oxidoreductase n=1 Tax=Marinobacter orientalis TaxID=1928859 RepID=A0A7Y0RDW6_9GAMM|nr:SDR family oxidoreductase [Marinobacter orientalis]NMT64411.1 SDR family oxidoreductase [Marinobacter orientalis]TGX50622.1 SDR family oxidoreductase [Marinobacter orientalis]